MTDEMVNTIGDEVKVMTKIAEVLTALSPEAKKRVLLWALEASGISIAGSNSAQAHPPRSGGSKSVATAKNVPTENSQTKAKTKQKGKSGPSKESYTMAKDVDFGLPGQANSLFDYLERYNPTSSIQKNVVFTKYLQEQHSERPVTADLIYSCYSTSGSKLPLALYASLLDTAKANKGYGYLDTSNINDIKIVHKGEVLLHELAKKTKDAGVNSSKK